MTDAQIRDGLISVLCEVTGLDREDVKHAHHLKDLGTWDSLSLVEFIIGASEVFSLEIEPKELRGCLTIDDLMQVIRVRQQQGPLTCTPQ